MSSNDDIMACLQIMIAQANTNTESLRKDVNEKLITLTEKVDKAKEDAIEKESRN